MKIFLGNPFKIFWKFFRERQRKKRVRKVVDGILKRHKETLKQLAKYEREHPES